MRLKRDQLLGAVRCGAGLVDRYYARAFGASNRLALLATAPFVWLPLLERFTWPRPNADGASGHYFFGKRAETQTLRETDMLAYYESQGRPVSEHQ